MQRDTYRSIGRHTCEITEITYVVMYTARAGRIAVARRLFIVSEDAGDKDGRASLKSRDCEVRMNL